jgi:HEAT repeat protein
MKDVNVRLCGNLWQNLGDQQAGWELIRCLRSSDPHVRGAAQVYLAEAGPRSIKLLQAAVALGALEGAMASECMVTVLDCLSYDTAPDEPAFSDLRPDC